MRVWYFLIIFVLVACGQKRKETPVQDKKDSIPTIVIKRYEFYNKLNIVVDDSTQKIYYHKYEPLGWLCGTGLDLSEPIFIDLSPEKLVQTNLQELEKLSTNYERDTFNLFIACSDSLNPILKDVANIFLSRTRVYPRYRKLTEEETYVLQYKTRNKKYDPSKINWVGPNVLYIKEDI